MSVMEGLVADLDVNSYTYFWPFVQLPCSLIEFVAIGYIFHVITFCTYMLLPYGATSCSTTEKSYSYDVKIS